MENLDTTLEIVAESYDEAVEKGLDQLGLPRDAVSIEVIDDGKGGFLGMGNRQVRVKLTINNESKPGNNESIRESPQPEETEREEFSDPLEEAKVKAERIYTVELRQMHWQSSLVRGASAVDIC